MQFLHPLCHWCSKWSPIQADWAPQPDCLTVMSQPGVRAKYFINSVLQRHHHLITYGFLANNDSWVEAYCGFVCLFYMSCTSFVIYFIPILWIIDESYWCWTYCFKRCLFKTSKFCKLLANTTLFKGISFFSSCMSFMCLSRLYLREKDFSQLSISQ